jgi:hypothetical protein
MLSAAPRVTVLLESGSLLLKGNTANCNVQVSQTAPGQFTVTGSGATLIIYNHNASAKQIVNGVNGGINVALPGAGGTQAFRLSDAAVHGSVNVNMGPGVEDVGIGFNGGATTIDGNLNINTVRGNSLVTESATTVRQNENINLGPGKRTIELDQNLAGAVDVANDFNINAIGSGSTSIVISEFTDGSELRVYQPSQAFAPELTVGNDFNITIGGGTLNATLRDLVVGNNFNLTSAFGNSNVTVTNASVGQNANITTGNGADKVSLDDFTSKGLNVSLGSNNDNLTLKNTTTTVGTNLDGGPGDDMLSYLGAGNSLARLRFFDFEVIV